MTIDMKSFMGEGQVPAATEQQVTSAPQAQPQYDEFAMPPMPPETPVAQDAQASEALASPSVEEAQERNFKALSESVEKLKAEREAEKRDYQLQLDMLRANLHKPAQEAKQHAPKMFDGMEDNDIPNVGDLRKAWNERESAYNERIEELQVANQYPDYAEVLGKYGKKLAETDPGFVEGIRGAANKALFAYSQAKKEQELQNLREAMKSYQAPASQQPSNNAQRIVDNARKPGTLAQAGGQSALSKADYIATMSDADFMKYASKHLEGI